MKKVIITPMDVLLFRSSRPFVKGENFVARLGDITPLPFAAAIRSKFLSTAASGDIPADWYDADRHPEFKYVAETIGTPNNEGKICFFGSYLSNSSKNELFQCPNDVVKSEDDENCRFLLKPSMFNMFEITGNYAVAAGQSGSFYVKEHGGFVTWSGLRTYLLGNVPNVNELISKHQVISEERRVGIEIDRKKRTTKKSMFYSIDYIRLIESSTFSVWINDSFGLPNRGLLKIGGEGRGAFYEISNSNELECHEIIRDVNRNRRFKLYLSTPAIFLGEDDKNVGAPSPDRLKGKLGVSVKLISMIPGKPMHLGGWDMATGMQKPLRYAVRSGAVYFYKIMDGMIDENLEIPAMISDINSRLGLGSAFIGKW